MNWFSKKHVKSATTTVISLDVIKEKIIDLYKEPISDLAEIYKFKTPPSKSELLSHPFILLLGNHSSGKSSFINYYLNTRVQSASAAPLDDGFTIFQYGSEYQEKSGSSVVLDERLPFQSLKNIEGNNFLGKLKMKTVNQDRLKHLMLVDSPGMIDSQHGRDFDFMQAVRWFSDRADLVLFFFDPDKPGTTGESLKVFTQILGSIDHKLMIVLNKIDTIGTWNDFVRTYGTLCWNLAKIIPYKDMPLINACFLPNPNNTESTLKLSLEEFEESRDDIVKKITNAPTRHVDTMITELQKYTERLLMHSRMLSMAKQQMNKYRFQIVIWAILISTIISTPVYFCIEPMLAIALLIASLIFSAVISKILFFKHETMTHQQMELLFHKEYFTELNDKQKYENLLRIWKSVKPSVDDAINKWGLASFPILSVDDISSLQQILNKDVQTLIEMLQKIIL